MRGIICRAMAAVLVCGMTITQADEYGTPIDLSGMIGPSFANVTNPNDATFASSDTLFNAGGAIGGGLLREVSDRLTFDVGYRYFHIDTITQPGFVQSNQFAASELMFSLRLYEPFRAWRR